MPWYSPTALTRSPLSSMPRRFATHTSDRVKQDDSEARNRSVGCGPVSVPPESAGSSTTISNPPASLTARIPPAHRVLTVRTFNMGTYPFPGTLAAKERNAARKHSIGAVATPAPICPMPDVACRIPVVTFGVVFNSTTRRTSTPTGVPR